MTAWGTAVEELAFPDPPPGRAWKEGLALLRTLGATDADGRLTDVGRRMVELPLHPRLARIVATAPSSTACVVATLVDERDVLRGRVGDLPADLALRVALVAGQINDDRADRGALRRLAARADDLARRAGIRFDTRSIDPDASGRLLLAGFPDRLAARRRPGQFQMRTGTTAWLADDDPLSRAAFVVAADLDGRRAGARIRLAAAVDGDDVATLLADVVERRRLMWDSDRDDLVLRIERRLDALALGEEVRLPTPGDDTLDALVDRVRATRLAVLTWSPAAEQLRSRVVEFLRRQSGGDTSPWPDLADKALLATLDTWLRPYLTGAVGRGDLQRVDVADAAAGPAAVAPRRRSGHARSGGLVATQWSPACRSTTPPTARPRAVRVQDVFGVTEHPTLAGGTVPLTLALLSPADRPIQVTADLPGFWAGSWADVRKDLAGRYPKHRWPENPAAEPPGRLKPR